MKNLRLWKLLRLKCFNSACIIPEASRSHMGGSSSLEQRHLWTVEWTRRSLCPAHSGRPKWWHLMFGLFNGFWERRLSFAPTLQTMMIRVLPSNFHFHNSQILTFSTILAFNSKNSKIAVKRSYEIHRNPSTHGTPVIPLGWARPLVCTRCSGHRKHGSTGWHGPPAENPPRPHLALRRYTMPTMPTETNMKHVISTSCGWPKKIEIYWAYDTISFASTLASPRMQFQHNMHNVSILLGFSVTVQNLRLEPTSSTTPAASTPRMRGPPLRSCHRLEGTHRIRQSVNSAIHSHPIFEVKSFWATPISHPQWVEVDFFETMRVPNVPISIFLGNGEKKL